MSQDNQVLQKQCAAMAGYIASFLEAENQTDIPARVQESASPLAVSTARAFRIDSALASEQLTAEQKLLFTQCLTDILIAEMQDSHAHFNMTDKVGDTLFMVGGYCGQNPSEVHEAFQAAGLPNMNIFPSDERMHAYSDGTIVVSQIGSEEQKFINYEGQPKLSYARILKSDCYASLTMQDSVTNIYLAVPVLEGDQCLTGFAGSFWSRKAHKDTYLGVDLLREKDDLLEKGVAALRDPDAHGISHLTFIEVYNKSDILKPGRKTGTVEIVKPCHLFRAAEDSFIYGAQWPRIKKGDIVVAGQGQSLYSYPAEGVLKEKVLLSRPLETLVPLPQRFASGNGSLPKPALGP